MLDERLDAHVGTLGEAATLGADDACGNRRVETERVANGDGPLTNLHVVTIAERDGVQVLRTVNLDQSNVGIGVGANHSRIVLAVVVQCYLKLLGTINHVIVGHDIAIITDNHARTAAFGLGLALLLRRLLLAAALTVAKTKAGAKEELKRVHSLVILLLLGCLKALDTDNTVDSVLGYYCKVNARGHRCATA